MRRPVRHDDVRRRYGGSRERRYPLGIGCSRLRADLARRRRGPPPTAGTPRAGAGGRRGTPRRYRPFDAGCGMSENTGGPLPDDVLPLAHRLLALDFSVIPVPRPRPGVPAGQPGDGKVPAIAWRTYQKRRPTAREIDTWFGAVPMNLAVITGPVSGVVIVDADDPEALRWLVRRLPWTPWQTQTARGFHLWYRHPGVRVPNRARVDTGVGTLKIDVRGDGGYVIAPGSVHASGAPYRQAGDWSEPRARVPVFWPGW